MYFKGMGVTQDYAQAVKCYRLAADQGKAAEQYNLGNMYVDGKGVTQDYVEPAKWYSLPGVSGIKNTARNCSIVEAKMTRKQIAEAQKRPAERTSKKIATDWLRK